MTRKDETCLQFEMKHYIKTWRKKNLSNMYMLAAICEIRQFVNWLKILGNL